MNVESWLQRAAAQRPHAAAIEAGGERLTYERLLAAAAAGARRIRELGVRPGDGVAIALPPGIDFAVALHACWLAGAAAVPIDLRLAPAERAAHAAGSAAILDAALLSREERELAAVPSELAALPGELAAAHDLDATAAVIHTSGTTSAPKRVALSFGNFLWSALGSAVALGAPPEERWLSTLPVCHVGGLSILVRSAIAGSTAVVHERFETSAALAAIEGEAITIVSVVATTLARLLDAGLKDPPALRVALAGGGPVPAALLRRAAAAGVPVSQTYGLTESCSQATTVPLATSSTRAGSAGSEDTRHDAAAGIAHAGDRAAAGIAHVGDGPAALGAGRPLFCTSVRIASDGEILLRGPTIAAASIAPDGWLHTGDLGRLDGDGNLHVTGRSSETIVSGGENVAPAEVEAVLEEHPDVQEAAVLGRSHPEWGEAVTAIVLPRAGSTPDLRQLRAHCARSLASYKIPKQLELTDRPLPRTRSGKLMRRQLS